jgi:hypothetical protein
MFFNSPLILHVIARKNGRKIITFDNVLFFVYGRQKEMGGLAKIATINMCVF